MKKLIKEICRREGGKSEVSIGNVREVLNHLTNILAEGNKPNEAMVQEFVVYLEKKAVKFRAAKLKKALKDK